MRWYSNKAVQEGIASVMENRESIWAQFPRSGDAPFWARRTKVTGHASVDYWTKTLNRDYNSIGAFIGSNIINWNAMDREPPPLRSKQFSRKQYAEIWKQYLTPEGCAERGLDWEDIWVGKTLVFDFDSPLNPMKSFHKADKLARYLKSLGYAPMVVFSGSKGFHVHMTKEDSEKAVGFKLADWKHLTDPLKKIGKLYAEKVVKLCEEAEVSYANEDRSPNFRQGIVRCPYSIHPKTGQIVWPLNGANLRALRKHKELSVIEIAKVLHPWDIPVQSFMAEQELTFITPEFKISSRGMPFWEE
tara:strand:+ start:2548 stop:3453 length:906 start_codon:yes stop_codon:yes gene_type:complete